MALVLPRGVEVFVCKLLYFFGGRLKRVIRMNLWVQIKHFIKVRFVPQIPENIHCMFRKLIHSNQKIAKISYLPVDCRKRIGRADGQSNLDGTAWKSVILP